MDELKRLIREVPDYPKPGILFYDLTTLLKDAPGFHILVDRLGDHYSPRKVDIVVGVEARGFIFAPALAYRLGVRASCLCASPESFQRRRPASPTNWNMAATLWRYTRTQSNPASTCW